MGKEFHNELGGYIAHTMLYGTEKEKKKMVDAFKAGRNELIKKKKELIQICLKKKYITKDEVKFFDNDDTVEYLNAVAHQEEFKKEKQKALFVTPHKPLLEKAKEFNERFTYIKLVSIKEAINLMDEEKKKETNYIG